MPPVDAPEEAGCFELVPADPESLFLAGELDPLVAEESLAPEPASGLPDAGESFEPESLEEDVAPEALDPAAAVFFFLSASRLSLR